MKFITIFSFFSIKVQENGQKEKRGTKIYSMKDVIEFTKTVSEKLAKIHSHWIVKAMNCAQKE